MDRLKEIDKFWNRVLIDGDACWNWGGGCISGGYGYCSFEGKRFLAHRLSYILHNGEIPYGFYVCHHCDNPRCVNPNHLFLGTQYENMRDMVTKGRGMFISHPGESNGSSKLTEDSVSEILHSDEKVEALARRHRVHPSTIYKIRNGKRWPKAKARKETAAAIGRNGRR